MKTDLVLTMDEYRDQCCGVPKRGSPPGCDARHISMTAGDNPDLNAGEHGCRCDRWGHPCPGCAKTGRVKELQIGALAESK
jgi:hypothetical protein